MWGFILLAAISITQVSAQWATHYSFEEGLIYLQLKNDDLVALNFSMAGFDGISADSLTSLNIQQNQRVQSLAKPPSNSSMFVHGGSLYAFTGAVDETLAEYDKCGDGIFQLLKYDNSQNSWEHASDNMTFSDVNDVSFYQGSTYLTSPSSSEIYIYGGTCSSTGTIVSRLLSLDMNTMSFANISTSTQPQGFYGSSNLWAPNPQQSFLIGGRSKDGWLNMYQLATWNFQSGWSFQTIQKNGTDTVSSRVNALTLPIFSVLADDSEKTFASSYNPTSVLVLGGDSAGSSDSEWAKLEYISNGWSWQVLDVGINQDDVLGAAVIFDTLVVVNKTSENSSKAKRSDTSYQLNLYSISDNFALVDNLKSNTASSVRSSSNTNSGISKNTKVLVGTLVPLSALGLIAGLVALIWRRKVTRNETASISDPLDYQLGHYRTRSDQPYSLLGSRPLDLYQHVHDSNSTIDVASIDSWVRKRQEYEATHKQPLGRQSFLASNDTLNSEPATVNDELESDMTEQSPAQKQLNTENEPETPKMDYSTMSMIQSPTSLSSPVEAQPKHALPIRLGQIRGFSYTQTPPQSPMIQRKSRLDPGFINLGEGQDLGTYGESDGESPDENIDVQVLVSSKRKSVLRVMNPDSEEASSEGMRLRNPSK